MNPTRFEALDRSRGLAPTPKNIDRVAVETNPDDSRWAFLQWELRKRARTKFALADQMLFVREALEQATHQKVATFRASRFPAGSLVADLTCGIGADLIALAARGPALGYEIDPERLECAQWNLQVHGFEAELMLHDCLEAKWDFQYAIADPARRVAGRRVLHPSGFIPDPFRLGARMSQLSLACLKLSPMVSDTHLDQLGPRIEFWSFDGECREAAIWLGSQTQPGRFCVQVDSGETLIASEPPIESEPSTWFYEADPAAIRSHALGTLAEEFGLSALGDSNGYLTGSLQVSSPWLRAYQVIEELPRDISDVRRRLEELNRATLIVKSRRDGADPAQLVKKWRMKGGTPCVVACYSVGRSSRNLLLELPEP